MNSSRHMATGHRVCRCVAGVICAVLGICSVARAQSAVENFDPGANSEVSAVAVQPDGKILVGGFFTTLGGGGTTTRNRIGRLNADGSLDTTFNPGANGLVKVLAVQADGKILVGGFFTGLGGGTGTTPRQNIGRLNADGSVDADFNPGASGPVFALVEQADGKILAGGSFSTLGGLATTHRSMIGRLNADGSVDVSFNPGATETTPNGRVNSIALQADGKIVIGGAFDGLGGGTGTTLRKNVARLNADGSVDSGFVSHAPANDFLETLALQPDGKVLIEVCSPGCGHVYRLTADGSLDTRYNAGVGGHVNALAVQADGKIVVGGGFSTLGSGANMTPRKNIGRLNADGSPDVSFDAGSTGMMVNALAVLADGTILVGGAFSTLGGGGAGTTPRSNIGLLTNTAAASDRLSVTAGGTVVTWARGGGGPEVSRASFELSTDGGSYTALASPTHMPGGWRASDQRLPLNQELSIRARGYYTTGIGNGSGSVVESIQRIFLAPPTISRLPNMPTRKDTPITIPFTIGSSMSGASAVTISASSSNPMAVPNANLVLVGTGANRTLTIFPAPHQLGATTITLTATDDGLTTTSSFVLVVHGTVRGDFSGRGKAGLTVFRPSNGTWFTTDPDTGTIRGGQWGNALDVPVPGDYDGDGRTDMAVFRPSNGIWYIVNSSTGTTTGVQWGNSADLPVPADYDGDGQTDIAVFRPSNGIWFIINSSTGITGGGQWGNAQDVTVPGDYDGDGKADLAVFRPSNGTWFILNSSTGTATGVQWGNGQDVPVPGDYDGDGKTDVAVFRPSNGVWYIVHSSTGAIAGAQWGNALDVPVPGDYDGDGRTDLAVFRPSNGTWFIVYSSTGTTTGVQWGNSSDIPMLKR